MSKTWISKTDGAAELAGSIILALRGDQAKLRAVAELLITHVERKPRKDRFEKEFDSIENEMLREKIAELEAALRLLS